MYSDSSDLSRFENLWPASLQIKFKSERVIDSQVVLCPEEISITEISARSIKYTASHYHIISKI